MDQYMTIWIIQIINAVDIFTEGVVADADVVDINHLCKKIVAVSRIVLIHQSTTIVQIDVVHMCFSSFH